VAGMASLALDPNSGYFDQEALALIQEEQSGQVEGIGALVATEEEGSDLSNSCQIITDTCRLRIVSTIEGSPARAAGLQEGDEFLAVDGQSIEGWTVDEVTAVVRGEAGTDVDLTFLREGEEFTVSITRAAVQVPVVQSEMVGEVAYLRLNIFTQNADEQLRGELGSLLYNNPEVLILDLRNNPGGLLDTAVEVTSEFLGEGLVVTTESPESTTPYVVEEGGIATDPELELYVLVNAGSASASEVVAGALADAGRATIVGENTFGKNTVQQRFPLSNGGALKLTIARWLTPNGNDFGGTGITPHVTADIPEELTATEIVSEVLGPMA
jgi:carboxyl-terminal processing protease